MLVLSRRAGQDTIINESITVTVVSVRGGEVKLAFSAPRDVSIRRAELEPFVAGEVTIQVANDLAVIS